MWRWLREDAYQEPRADVFCLNLAQREEPVMARDLDLSRCAEPYAYPLASTGVDLAPLLLTEAILLANTSPIKLSSDLAAFTARLKAEQPWLPVTVAQETLAAIQYLAQTANARAPAARAPHNRPGLGGSLAQRLRSTRR
jgi:hypothetical protein